MIFVVTVILLTKCGTTIESRLPEHPQKIYYKSQAYVSDNNESNTTPQLNRQPNFYAHNVHYSFPLRSAHMKAIQYAPLQLSQDLKDRYEEKSREIRPTQTPRMPFTNATVFTTPKGIYNKEHLEPRKKGGTKHYSPGLKIKGAPSVSRSPGYNVVYQNGYLQPGLKDKTLKDPAIYSNKIRSNTSLSSERPSSEVRSPVLHRYPVANRITYMKPYPKLSDPTTSMAYALNPIHAGKNQKFDKDHGKDSKSKRQPASVSSKLHRIHLNIARVYSPGQVAQKSPVFVDMFPLPEQESQAMLLPQGEDAAKNTVLLPVPAKAIQYIK